MLRHCLLFAWILLALRGQAARSPNIILILADDLGINDLSCYGRKEHRTPHLDRLAAEGLRFTSATCAQPICSPSRAALLTGKAPARLHLTSYLPGRADAPAQKLRQPVMEGRLPLEEITLAELLRDAGYATACVGKWHLGGPGFGPAQQGFEHAFTGRADTTPSATEGSKGEYELTAEAMRWMETQRERPFFLYLPHNTPHIPFAATAGDRQKNATAFNPAYAAVIGHLDACVGQVLAKVDALGLREQTIVVFTSDNGGLQVLEFPGTPATHNTPYRGGKGFLTEGGLRVPLLIRWPGQITPGVRDEPLSLMDLTPTLLAAAGRDHSRVTGPLDGENLLPWFRGGPAPVRRLFWHFPHYANQGGRPAGALRDGDWKLIENYEDGTLELYDLASDPGETRNRAVTESRRAQDMQAALAGWRIRVGAQEMTPNPEYDRSAAAKLYLERDSSRLPPATTAAATETAWAGWRQALDQAVQGRQPKLTPATGDVRLAWSDAQVHGDKIQQESAPNKRTVGYWVNPTDWVEWTFTPPAPGRYEIEILQGCGQGSGGSEVGVKVGDQSLAFTVVETGHFQQFIQRVIGTVMLGPGTQRIEFRPRSKPGPAVMDLRRVVFRPVP